MEMVSIGFSCSVKMSGIDAITPPDSAPIKRMIVDARIQNRLVDCTQGRKTRSVIVMESGAVILSAIAPDTITERIRTGDMSIVSIKPPSKTLVRNSKNLKEITSTKK